MDREALIAELARARGLGEAYYDHGGTLRYFSFAARCAILKAMGVDVDNVDAVRAALKQNVERASNDSRASMQCYQPSYLEQRKCWGLSIQLYSLRSERNWGIGDFADLRELIDLAAPLGCDVIGLNPLHALFLARPQQSSPYSPSSRLFLNVLYLAIEDIPEFQTCVAARELCAEPSFQSALAALRMMDWVMYEQVATLKLCVLRLLFEEFSQTHLEKNSDRAKLFRQFIEQRGQPLRSHLIFEALDMHFQEQGVTGWRNWPAKFHNPNSDAVREFAVEQAEQVLFYGYAQWLAEEQLTSAQRYALEQGMHIGLYGDLAVGANPDGSEVWSNPSLYLRDVSVGAPPDPLALSGQDWGIPPIDPTQLRLQALQPFIDLLRANMRQVGALRIDHVMSLFRLWWVPRGFNATDGVYVHYPLDELVAQLARESVQARCLVIGEDLGTVPDEIRDAMERGRLYHYKVLLFEKSNGRFKTPFEYPRHSIAAVATHDLPPLKAWWQGDDLELRDRLGLYPSENTAQELRAERAADRRALLTALNDQALWFWRSHERIPEFSAALARAIQLYLGKTEAALVLVQLEDLIGMIDPVNVPGTHEEHANWQRKLTENTRDILSREDVREQLSALAKIRSGINPNR